MCPVLYFCFTVSTAALFLLQYRIHILHTGLSTCLISHPIPMAPQSAEKPYLKMWVRRAEEKQQKQRTKVIKRDPNPQFGQTFFWCFVIGDFFVLRHYEWGSLRDAKLGSYEVNVMHLDFNGSEQWVPLSDQGGEVLLSWHLGQAPA